MNITIGRVYRLKNTYLQRELIYTQNEPVSLLVQWSNILDYTALYLQYQANSPNKVSNYLIDTYAFVTRQHCDWELNNELRLRVAKMPYSCMYTIMISYDRNVQHLPRLLKGGKG